MADPLSIASAIATAKELLDGAGGVWEQFKKLRGDWGVFWRHFEREAGNKSNDIPWDQVERYRLEPEFIGRVTVLIDSWDYEARAQIREIFITDLSPIATGELETKEKLADRLVDAVIASAIRTGQEVKKTPQQIIGAIETSGTALAEHVSDAAREVSGRVSHETREALEEDRARRNQDLREIVRSELARDSEQNPEKPEQTDLPPSESDPSATRPIESLSQQADLTKSPDDLVRELHAEDPMGAGHLQRFLDEGGAMAVVVFIRGRQGPEPDDSLAFLVTAARIAAQVGAWGEAEEAYVWASQLDGLDDRARARQLVRAAAMAQLSSGDERFRALLEDARQLDPDHPALAIAEARASRDSEWMLMRIANVVPENNAEEALLHVTRAQANLALGHENLAVQELETARAADAEYISVREFGSILSLIVAQQQVSRGEQPDRGALRRAAEGFEKLRPALEDQARWDESAQLAARAAECYSLAEEFERATEILLAIKRPERLNLDARKDAARAALVARRPSLVLSFIREADADAEARLLRANVQTLSGDAATRVEGVETLLELLEESDENVRSNAAFTLLAAASTEKDVAWNDRAAELVAAVRPVMAAIFRAEHLWLHDQRQEAEHELLPYAGDRQALRRLRDYAARQSQWGKAEDRSRSLMRENPSALDRLTNAEILRQSRGPAEAKAEFLAVGHDDDLPDELRNQAFASAMETVAENRNYTAIRDLAREWHDAVPISLDAVWNLAFALARLAEHAEAFKVVTENDLEARTEQQAQLLAEVLHRGAPKIEALQRLGELSNEFDRPEQMEAILLWTFFEVEQDGIELDEKLISEIGSRFESFWERFPDSKILRRIKAPETVEELRELMRAMHRDSATAQNEVRERVRAGQASVNELAVVSTVKEVGSAWARLGFFPMGFAMPALEEHERAIAAEAIGGAAVWDPSTLCTVGGLGTSFAKHTTAALPGSLIVNETLEDADAAASGLSLGRGKTEMGFDPAADQPWIAEVADTEIERHRLRAEGMLRLAKEFDVEPGPGETTDRSLIEVLHDPEEPHSWKVFIATLMLAERTGRPIFSDDRWIRQFAHQHGLRAFGTLALLDALRDRGLIDNEERRRARLRLAASRSWGVALTVDEMTDAARAAGWEITPALVGALTDRAVWRSRPGQRFQEWIAFMQIVHQEAPETLGKWLRRIITAGLEIGPHLAASWWSKSILVMAWGVDQPTPTMSDRAFQALIDEVRALPPHLSTLGPDPGLQAMDEILSYFADKSGAVKGMVFKRLIRRLRFTDQLAAMETFVRK